jgi:dipeptidyl aminopeptidase/acylaminoacyl peptidase
MVAFVKSPVAKSEERETSEIWVTTVEGSAERRFTYGPGAESSPRWSPDGRGLTFTSDRDKEGTAQLFIMPSDGGEATQLTTGKASVSSPLWSPSGQFIAFLRPDEETEEEERDKRERRDYTVVEENLKMVRLHIVRPDGGGLRRVSPEGAVNVWEFCWSPGGSELAAGTSSSPRISDYRAENRMLGLTLDGGWRELFAYDSFIGRPRWSADGGSIAFLGHSGRVRSGDALFVASVRNGETRAVMPAYPGAISALEWSSVDCDHIIFTALENLHGAVNEVDVKTGEFRSVLVGPDASHGTFGSEMGVDSAGRSFVVVRSAGDEPAELFLGGKNCPLRRLTDAGRDLKDVAFRPAETVQWASSDGTVIYGLLVRPRSAAGPGPYPLVLNIHGGPASAFSDRLAFGWHDWGQVLAASGYAVLMPNPRGSVGRGAAFTDANIKDLAGMEYQDLMTGVDSMIERGIADPHRMGVAGWSHGGYMTAWVVTHTDRFKAAVMGAGLSNLVSDQGTSDIPGFNLDYFYEDYPEMYSDLERLWDRSPLKHVSNTRTPTLVLHGEKDDRVAVSQGQEFYRALQSLGVETRMVIYPREPHGIREREHQLDVQRRILDWFDTRVKDNSSHTTATPTLEGTPEEHRSHPRSV